MFDEMVRNATENESTQRQNDKNAQTNEAQNGSGLAVVSNNVLSDSHHIRDVDSNSTTNLVIVFTRRVVFRRP